MNPRDIIFEIEAIFSKIEIDSEDRERIAYLEEQWRLCMVKPRDLWS